MLRIKHQKVIEMKEEVKKAFNYIGDFFKQNTENSMARLISFILVISGIIFAFIHPDHVAMASLMIGIGVTGKVIQKKTEAST